MKRPVLTALVVLACVSPAAAFIRSTVSTSDATVILWDLDESLMPLVNVAGGEILYVVDIAGSDDIAGTGEMAAVERAFDHWEGIGTSRVAFSRLPDQDVQAADNDGINVVYWAEGARTSVGGTNENVDGYISKTPVFSVASGPNKGLILDANVILNGRQKSWTVTPDLNPTFYDVEAVVTHEIGHLIGLEHTPVLSASLSPRYVAGEIRQRLLQTDDLLGATAIYPEAIQPPTGGISGAVGRPAAVFGALVGVQDLNGNTVAETLTAANGSYSVPGLPPGDYDVYVDPIDPMPPSSTNLFDESDLGGVYGPTVDSSFFASLPLLTSVAEGSNTTRSFTVGSTAPLLNIAKIGGRASTLAAMVFTNAPTFAFQGDTILIGVAGPNLGGSMVFEITGAGITDNGVVATGSVAGEPSVVKSFSFAATAPLGLRTIRVSSGALGRTYATGALRILPNSSTVLTAPGMWFSAPGEVNTGRFASEFPVTIARKGDDLEIDWDDETLTHGYHVYRGTLASLASGLYDHQALPGTVNGQCRITTSYSLLKGEAQDPTDVYYLVSAYNNAGEGIVGRDSASAVMPPAAPACPSP